MMFANDFEVLHGAHFIECEHAGSLRRSASQSFLVGGGYSAARRLKHLHDARVSKSHAWYAA
jgi:hypothetical protein